MSVACSVETPDVVKMSNELKNIEKDCTFSVFWRLALDCSAETPDKPLFVSDRLQRLAPQRYTP